MSATQPMSSAQPSARLKYSNAIGYIVLIAFNVASQTGLLGDDNATISAKFPTPLTPSGWAFSIWGIIFLLQGAGVVYQFMPQGYGSDGWKARIINTIGYGWVVGWAFEVAWQAVFLLESPVGMWICLVLILGAFVSFGRALLRLYGLKHQHGSMSSLLLFSFYWLPTSINTAWLSVASSVAALVVPSAYGVVGEVNLVAVSLAAVLTVIGVLVVQWEKDSMYGLTLVWALTAVYGEQSAPLIAFSALICITVLLIVVLLSILRRQSNKDAGIQLNEEVRQSLVGAAEG